MCGNVGNDGKRQDVGELGGMAREIGFQWFSIVFNGFHLFLIVFFSVF